MKRALAGIVAVLMLVAAGAGWWFWWRVPQHPTAASYLSPTTLLFVELPDSHRAWLHYQGSKLRQIVEQSKIDAHAAAATPPQAKAVLATDSGSFGEPWKNIAAAWEQSVGSGSFLAVTQCAWTQEAGQALDPKEIARGTGVITGFYRSPEAGKHADELVRQLANGATPVTATHGTVSYSAYDLPEWGIRLCRARWGDWDLVSLGEPALFDFLDRAAAHDTHGSLRDSADYAATMKRVDSDADVFVYSDTHQIMALYQRVLTVLLPGMGSQTLWARWGFKHGSAMSLSLRDGNVAMRSSMAAPQAERGPLATSFAPLPLASLRFTTPSTVFYLAGNSDWELLYAQERETLQAMQAATASPGTPPPPAIDPFDAMEKNVKAQGLDLHENFLRAIGPEMALIADWPAGQEIPDVMLLFAVKDPAKFSPLYDKYTKMFTPFLGMIGTSQALTVGEFQGVSVTPNAQPHLSPTLFDGPSFWGLSLTASGAQRLLASQKGTMTPQAFEGPQKLPGQPYCALYMKTSELVGRGYPAVRPLLAQFLGADVAAKLPPTFPAASQLGAMRMIGKSDGDFLVGSMDSPDGGVGVSLALLGAFQGSMEKLLPHPPIAAPAPGVPVAVSPQP